MDYSLLVSVRVVNDAEQERLAEANYEEAEHVAQLRVSAQELSTPSGLVAFWAKWFRFLAETLEKVTSNGA